MHRGPIGVTAIPPDNAADIDITRLPLRGFELQPSIPEHVCQPAFAIIERTSHTGMRLPMPPGVGDLNYFSGHISGVNVGLNADRSIGLFYPGKLPGPSLECTRPYGT